MLIGLGVKNITIVSCHSREGGNLDTCFRRYDTKFVSPNSIGFTIFWLAINNLIFGYIYKYSRFLLPTNSYFHYFLHKVVIPA
ncbi:hypothetical protein [Candidatus Tisiphia endosymbiont of Hybos culiciformis]|uniref:hypothetical protein n=1 Tax=Candidatus Tisiphia endosymbiont of Hybos culiciformis TaxID=3139331 RepID=UPI003CCB03BC